MIAFQHRLALLAGLLLGLVLPGKLLVLILLPQASNKVTSMGSEQHTSKQRSR